MVNTPLLRQEIKSGGYNLGQVATMLDLSNATMTARMKKGNFTIPEINTLSRALNLNKLKMVNIFFTDFNN